MVLSVHIGRKDHWCTRDRELRRNVSVAASKGGSVFVGTSVVVVSGGVNFPEMDPCAEKYTRPEQLVITRHCLFSNLSTRTPVLSHRKGWEPDLFCMLTVSPTMGGGSECLCML